MSDAPAALHSVSMSPLLKTLPGPFSSLRDEEQPFLLFTTT
ncbi:unnamed protein product [Cuscuta epithymum]|uniref:Uncharacterized protein n=1 Tax=Cuscuta epithymum TaxID=186058 RepID=A0AAV0F4Q9_9ASTE|nr:unnamed protein product [Cuscuta epithymum]